MKIYFTAFVVLMAILSLVHDSQEFTAGAGTTVGRRSFEKVKRLKLYHKTFQEGNLRSTKHFVITMFHLMNQFLACFDRKTINNELFSGITFSLSFQNGAGYKKKTHALYEEIYKENQLKVF